MEWNGSQKIKILRWMQNKGSITPQDALTFGCMRLAARIKNLRSDGYASYRLRNQECAQTTDT